ncbi:MAG TPA: helix-turn-helix transcriptional regulator, partial [Rudaea sp.]
PSNNLGVICVPNLAKTLKDEIIRLARREARAQTAALHRASAGYRREIAALKRQNATLGRTLKALSKQPAQSQQPAAPAEKLRFRADGFKTLRAKLGLSAEQMGALLGVSGQSVYLWERKRATPRRSVLPAIAQLRTLGKRQVMQKLEEISAAAKNKPRATRKRRGKSE